MTKKTSVCNMKTSKMLSFIKKMKMVFTSLERGGSGGHFGVLTEMSKYFA